MCETLEPEHNFGVVSNFFFRHSPFKYNDTPKKKYKEIVTGWLYSLPMVNLLFKFTKAIRRAFVTVWSIKIDSPYKQ